MKLGKKVCFVFFVVVTAFIICSCTKSSSDEIQPYKIGISVQSLDNPVWSAACSKMKELADAAGYNLTYVSADQNASKQLEQVENFITAGCDAIMINPVDANSMENVSKEAREFGIKVMSWDDNMENTDLNWLVNNFEVGKIVGLEAAEFINKNFVDGACEVAILDYPQIKILLERANGIIEGLKQNAPNAKIVAQQPAINSVEGQSAMESIIQSNPDIKVVCAIGGGGSVGANEAFKAAGLISDDIGIFAVDATEQELTAVKNKEAIRMSVILTGTPDTIGETAYGLIISMLDGSAVEKNIYRDAFPVNSENLSEYFN